MPNTFGFIKTALILVYCFSSISGAQTSEDEFFFEEGENIESSDEFFSEAEELNDEIPEEESAKDQEEAEKVTESDEKLPEQIELDETPETPPASEFAAEAQETEEQLQKQREAQQQFEQAPDAIDLFRQENPSEPIPNISNDNEMIDRSLKVKPRYITHPNASKGLYKITSDKVYLYRVERSKQDRSASFRVGFFQPTQLENKESGTRFSDIYGSGSNPVFLFDYEWQLGRKYGRFGLKLGSGIFVGTGNGQFKDGTQAQENFTLVVLPNTASAIYRFQYSDQQTFVPYIEGGGDVFTFTEIRDDGATPKVGLGLGAHGAGGIALNVSKFDMMGALQLDKEYGINTLYLTAEFRYTVGFSDFDFTGDIINLGFVADF